MIENKTIIKNMNPGNVCKITNNRFSWVLEVDGETIMFHGSNNADYFIKLYTKLGYTVEQNITCLLCGNIISIKDGWVCEKCEKFEKF